MYSLLIQRTGRDWYIKYAITNKQEFGCEFFDKRNLEKFIRILLKDVEKVKFLSIYCDINTNLFKDVKIEFWYQQICSY